MSNETEYYKAWRARVVVHLGGQCVQCEATENLELDHIDPEQKSYPVSAWWSYAWDRQQTELAKCQPLCAPCHDEKHAPKHGTIGCYRHRRCRCDACRTAWNEACRRWKGR